MLNERLTTILDAPLRRAPSMAALLTTSLVVCGHPEVRQLAAQALSRLLRDD